MIRGKLKFQQILSWKVHFQTLQKTSLLAKQFWKMIPLAVFFASPSTKSPKRAILFAWLYLKYFTELLIKQLKKVSNKVPSFFDNLNQFVFHRRTFSTVPNYFSCISGQIYIIIDCLVLIHKFASFWN